MLTLQELRQRCAAGESFTYNLFWGHKPANDGSVTKSCLSQWWEATFKVDGLRYPTAEHWMMAGKARLFGDEDSLARILDASSPKSAKALGRKVKNFDDQVWKEHASQIVVEGNLAKFRQNADLKAFLLDTDNDILVEASPYDRVWGIGLRASDPEAKHPDTWQGQNQLGFALVEVREQLRAEE